MNNYDLYKFTHKGAESVSDIVKKSIKSSGVELINETSYSDATGSNMPYYYNQSLLSIDMPNAKSMGEGYFENCRSLTTGNFPKVSSMGHSAFVGCVSLEYIYIPEVQAIPHDAFYGCISLKNINIDSAKSIGTRAFQGCYSITNAYCPNVSSVGAHAFHDCISMRSFIGPNVSTIDEEALRGCVSLMCVRLDNSDIVTLSQWTTFWETPIQYGAGYIYVNDELVDSYKSATNWVAYADKIKPISELS